MEAGRVVSGLRQVVKSGVRRIMDHSIPRLAALTAEVLLAAALAAGATDAVRVKSPDRRICVTVGISGHDRLVYSATAGGRPFLDESPLGIVVDGRDLGRKPKLRKPGRKRHVEPFMTRGVRSVGTNRWNAARIPVSLDGGKFVWTLEMRVFDGGFAYRYVVPGGGCRTVTGEKSGWSLPDGAVVWYQSRLGHYEGDYNSCAVEVVPRAAAMGMPVVFRLSDSAIHGAILEAGGTNYCGMALRRGTRNCLEGFFNDQPQGWPVGGRIESTWRVTLAGDLDELVNSGMMQALVPAPDRRLFPGGPESGWIRPGRCLWPWWAFNEQGAEWGRQKKFVDDAARLGCAYYLVDSGWEMPQFGWNKDGFPRERLRELCGYAAERDVGIFVWRGRRDGLQGPGLETHEKRRRFLDECAAAGAVGVKIDYLDAEDTGTGAFCEDILRMAAERRLMVNFHGAPKPRGESVTWPNEITREGLKGLEHNKWRGLAPAHYATLPFTRYLAGHGDFTPTTFQPRFLKGTTPSLQLAAAVVMTSPLLVWADRPDVYLESPAVDLIRDLPATWDKTVVLPGSGIGDIAAFARRSGADWWVGIVNGRDARDYGLKLSFLGEGAYVATTVSDVPGQPASMAVTNSAADRSGTLSLRLERGGGFTGRFTRLAVIPCGGGFDRSVTVTLSAAAPGGVIRYTLDGSKPDERSPRYAGPIVLDRTTTLRAALTGAGSAPVEICRKFIRLD